MGYGIHAHETSDSTFGPHFNLLFINSPGETMAHFRWFRVADAQFNPVSRRPPAEPFACLASEKRPKAFFLD
jgi:hypothetical protein